MSKCRAFAACVWARVCPVVTGEFAVRTHYWQEPRIQGPRCNFRFGRLSVAGTGAVFLIRDALAKLIHLCVDATY